MKCHKNSLIRAIVASTFALVVLARCKAGAAADVRSSADASPRGFTADLRFAPLIRSQSGYFQQAQTFGFPIANPAGGVTLNLGFEVLPRVSLFASGTYAGQGANREGFAKLMLTSESLLIGTRIAFLRVQSEDKGLVAMFQLEATGAIGRYSLRETYTDPLLSSTAFVNDASGAGVAFGLDASVHVSALRFVVGYAYNYAPASVSNEIGGVVRAGGHEISLGVGVRL